MPGRRLEFGVSLEPRADRVEENLRLARAAERLGLELIGIQDHPYQRRFLDTWTYITWLAAATSRISFFPDVANLPLRPPAVLAKSAASLDLLTGGRVELAIGAGGFPDAVAAMGGPRRTPGEAVAATAEAIEVIRAAWSQERSVRVDGEHYRLRGYKPGPPPAHDIGIWVGAGGDRMLDLIGRAADGWVPSLGWLPPGRMPERQARIDAAATAAGREPATIRRVLNVSGRIGPETGEPLDGPVEHWVEALTGLTVSGGMDTYILWPAEDRIEQLELFASEVVPAVREATA
jgi:alkanesulfonate monooxygenase SsuD/methylene tetrahydromethanopterin reductase-like flavin-dependent oxidoreductase (luciferase family)